MRLAFLEPEHFEDIENYYIATEKEEFSIAPSKAISLTKEKNSMRVVVVYEIDKLIGCFTLDTGADVEKYTSNNDAILFGKFTIDSRYARQGYATKLFSMLPEFIRIEYPLKKEIVLGVYERNNIAQSLYKKVGFVDTGRHFLGPIGELHVYAKKI